MREYTFTTDIRHVPRLKSLLTLDVFHRTLSAREREVHMFLHALDEWIITRIFEPIAWRLEYRFSIKGEILAFAFHMLGITCFLVVTCNAGMMLISLLLLAFAILLIVLHQYRSEMPSSAGTMNSSRQFWYTRLMLIASFVWNLYRSWFGIGELHEPIFYFISMGLLLYVAGMYFQACNELPPWWRPVHRFAEQKT